MKTLLLVYLSVAMVVMGLPSLSAAMLLPTESGPATTAAVQRLVDLQELQRHLESKMFAQRLADLGLSPGDVQARLQGLSDEQLHQVAQQLDGVQTGGELILILAIIGAVVLVLALLGWAHLH